MIQAGGAGNLHNSDRGDSGPGRGPVMPSFAVLGSGGWGTAVAVVLGQRPDSHVRLWSAREATGRALRQRRGAGRRAGGSGPGAGGAVARGLPTSVVAASPDAGIAGWVQEQLGGERLRVYTNTDLVGVELAGALKNVIGIAAGVCDGLRFGDN